MSNPSPKAGGASLGTVLFGLAFLAGAGVFAYLELENTKQKRRGPTEVQASALAEAKGLEGLPTWVKFTPAKVTDTGVRRARVINNVPNGTFKYLLVQVGERFIVAESWDDAAKAGTVSGYLEQWPARDKDGVVAEIYGKVPACRDKLAPFQLDTHKADDAELPVLWVLAGICGLFGVALVWTGVFGFKAEMPTPQPEPVVDDPVSRWMAARPPSRERY